MLFNCCLNGHSLSLEGLTTLQGERLHLNVPLLPFDAGAQTPKCEKMFLQKATVTKPDKASFDFF